MCFCSYTQLAEFTLSLFLCSSYLRCSHTFSTRSASSFYFFSVARYCSCLRRSISSSHIFLLSSFGLGGGLATTVVFLMSSNVLNIFYSMIVGGRLEKSAGFVSYPPRAMKIFLSWSNWSYRRQRVQ